MEKIDKEIEKSCNQTKSPKRAKIIKAKDKEVLKNLKSLKRIGSRRLRVKPWIENLHTMQNMDSVNEATIIIEEIQTVNSEKERSMVAFNSFPSQGKIPEKWFDKLKQLEVPAKYHGTMCEIVNHFIDSQVVMVDNDAEMEAAIDLVRSHAQLNCLDRLQLGEYVPISIVEDFGKRFQYMIVRNGGKYPFCLKGVRMMFQGNPKVYIGRLSPQFDPKLFDKSKDFKQLLWEVGVIFRKGDGKGQRKRAAFYGPDKNDKRIMLPYYWDYRKTMDKVVMVGLFSNRKVRIIAEQPPEKFSSYAFSLFGDVPIKQAKEIVAKVNVAMNLYRNAKPRFPEIYFDRECSLLIVTNGSIAYGIRVEKVGSVEIEKIKAGRVSPRWESFTKIINYSRDEGIRRSRKKVICPLFEYLSDRNDRNYCKKKSEPVRMEQVIEANL
ncbi:MAG: hypothetical protein D8M57_08380 [Candidatus Scalindua sp. AMX11]|nr:MAG: hypothetical protein DWQ00_05235 [Candidatus Scalindua sp.]NOG84358.1 hypothetical protein [Planctomycetota bacterium]RZV74439.1 MAG: hypothetical protein EX341_13115 [Candidatus Scalindua sp. SCAELEC01]TDE65360.1 MAG: hypothetical protein D8M57_08380 [Candidatus Scalindua sp. AMX11]GJQ60816.1 MAG: hypothetical protein SCALA701_36170 [Candidatus Scalindua sp.]